MDNLRREPDKVQSRLAEKRVNGMVRSLTGCRRVTSTASRIMKRVCLLGKVFQRSPQGELNTVG